MADGTIKDVLALAEAINSKRENDREFQDVLNEMSATLSELREWLEKAEGSSDKGQMRDLADALASAVSSIPAPTVNVPAPVVSAATWKELDVKFETATNGAITGARIKRLS